MGAETKLKAAAESLRDDNSRLRTVIKVDEWDALDGDQACCPWCGAFRDVQLRLHHEDCPAFTPEGEVR